MLIREMSDLHLEICNFFVPPMVGDEDTILLLSGDIFCMHYRGADVNTFLTDTASRFRKVLMIPGNHEYYKSTLEEFSPKFNAWLSETGIGNMHMLDMGSITIDDVAFIGATLWTDVNKGNPYSKMVIEGGMNDYDKIRTQKGGYRKIRANDTALLHMLHKRYIFEQVAEYRAIGVRKTVVMSHHAPSQLSVHEKYRGNELNAGYYSNMEYKIMDLGPDIWFHGHCHDSFSYELGATNVYCNPRGYSNLMNRNLMNSLMLNDEAVDPADPNSAALMDQYKRIYLSENPTFDPFFRIDV